MAINNPMSIKEAVDQVIDSLGASNIGSLAIEADDWIDFCNQVGADPESIPVNYRDVDVYPTAVGGAVVITLNSWRVP